MICSTVNSSPSGSIIVTMNGIPEYGNAYVTPSTVILGKLARISLGLIWPESSIEIGGIIPKSPQFGQTPLTSSSPQIEHLLIS
jgi:hypothetical protein